MPSYTNCDMGTYSLHKVAVYDGANTAKQAVHTQSFPGVSNRWVKYCYPSYLTANPRRLTVNKKKLVMLNSWINSQFALDSSNTALNGGGCFWPGPYTDKTKLVATAD